MANTDIIVTLPSGSPNPLGPSSVDLVFFDLNGDQSDFEWTVKQPTANAIPGSPTRASQATPVRARKGGLSRLTPLAGIVIDVNSTNLQNLFTLQASTSLYPINGCIITHMVLRAATLSLTTVSVAAGWNAAGNNVFATATHTELTGPTLATPVLPTAGQVIGLASGSFGIKNSIAQGAAGNATVDVFGYIF